MIHSYETVMVKMRIIYPHQEKVRTELVGVLLYRKVEETERSRYKFSLLEISSFCSRKLIKNYRTHLFFNFIYNDFGYTQQK